MRRAQSFISLPPAIFWRIPCNQNLSIMNIVRPMASFILNVEFIGSLMGKIYAIIVLQALDKTVCCPYTATIFLFEVMYDEASGGCGWEYRCGEDVPRGKDRRSSGLADGLRICGG
jgi:hypothetical protein